MIKTIGQKSQTYSQVTSTVIIDKIIRHFLPSVTFNKLFQLIRNIFILNENNVFNIKVIDMSTLAYDYLNVHIFHICFYEKKRLPK